MNIYSYPIIKPSKSQDIAIEIDLEEEDEIEIIASELILVVSPLIAFALWFGILLIRFAIDHHSGPA